MEFKTAQRKAKKLRIGIAGQSGAGKTFGALKVAYGLVGDWAKVGLVDTENSSGEMYDSFGPWQHLNLQKPFSPERYIEAIGAAHRAGIECLVMDSATHEWDFCKEEVDRISQSSASKNSFQAWGKVTPRHKAFINAIISSPMHMIITIRLKTDYVQDKDDRGKTVIQKVGLKEEQREGFEYELDISFRLLRDGHWASTDKDRTGLFSGRTGIKLNEEIGQELKVWSASGAAIAEEAKAARVIFNALEKEHIEWLKVQPLVKGFNPELTKKIAKMLHDHDQSELPIVIELCRDEKGLQ